MDMWKKVLDEGRCEVKEEGLGGMSEGERLEE